MTSSPHDPGASAPATPSGRARAPIRIAIVGTGLVGLGVAIALILRSGVHDVLALLGTAGWALFWLLPAHVVMLALDASGWRVLLGAYPRATVPFLTWAATVRDSINGLLPVARVGGDVAGARLATLRGVPGAAAGASVIVEITVFLAVQVLFALLGVGILFYYLRDSAAARAVMLGLAVSVPAVTAFFLIQRHLGLFGLLERVLQAVAGRSVLATLGDPAALDRAIRELYGRRGALLGCAGFQIAAMLAGTGELWLALYILGHPASLLTALLLESLAQAVQSAFFMVPGALGAQEGGFILFGAAAGLSADVAIALSLARRVRLVGLGVPALLTWQWVEGKRLGLLLGRSGGQDV